MRDRALAILVVLIGSVSFTACGLQPTMNTLATQEGLASYYGKEFQGRKTSNGELFDPARLTAAHRTFPFGTRVLVTNLDNDQAVQVRINDRGPVKPERIIDLSTAAAAQIGIDRSGLGRVRIQVIEWGGHQDR